MSITSFKLGQVFWMRDERSDYECTVVGTKVCEFLNNPGFTDYLVSVVRINDFHVSFYPIDKRTKEISFRYLNDEQRFTEWQEPREWPGHVPGKWTKPTYKFFITKPKDLRKCEHNDKSYKEYLKTEKRQ